MRRHDVVVVGAGVTGLGAAIEAAELGAKVLVLEAQNEIGGASAASGAGCLIVDSPLQREQGVTDSVEAALADLVATGGPSVDLAWARRYLEASTPEVYTYCEQLGIAWELLAPIEGCRVPRWHFARGLGRGIVDALRARASVLGVEVVCNAPVTELLVEDGVVHGVAATHSGIRRTHEAAAVVVCAGGFAGNHALVLRHSAYLSGVSRVLSGSTASADGSGTEVLARAGAQFAHLERIWVSIGTPDPADPRGERGLIVLGVEGGIRVNSAGRRFHDESVRTGHTGSEALLAQPGQSAWFVFNEAELATVQLADNEYWGSPGEPRASAAAEFVERSDHVRRGGSVHELAVATGLPPAALEATVAAFNRAVDAGAATEPDFGRSLARATRLEGPGLVAVQIFPLAQKNLGGVRTDLDCRVLDADDAPIRGLYAAGEVAGMAGGNLNGEVALEGTMFGVSLFAGRVAGRAAASVRV